MNTKKSNLSLLPPTFQDLFVLSEIQSIQDAFAKATGVASIITEIDGTPITKPSNFCRLCNEIIRKTDKGLINCMNSDAFIGRHNPHGPIVQPCLSGGLWDAGASISVGGRHIANWLIGQVRNDKIDEHLILEYAAQIGADEKEFRAALDEVTIMSSDQFEQVSQALFLIANQLSQFAYQKTEQEQIISKQQKIEQALLKSEIKYRQIYDNILDVYYESSLDGILLEISPSIEKHSQYKREDLIGKSLYSLYTNPADREKLIEIIINKGSVRDYEIMLTDKDGSQHICSMNIDLARDDKNKPTKLVGIFRDITERIQADEKLRQSEEKFRTAFRTSPNAITLTNFKDGIYIDINDGFTKMLGYPREDVIGKSSIVLNIWNNSKDRELLVAGIKKNGIVENLEAEFKGKNGQILNGLMSARLLHIDNTDLLLAVTQDITERIQSEEALKEKSDFLDQIIDTSAISMWISDEKGTAIRTNPACLKFFGATEEEVIGKYNLFQDSVIEEKGYMPSVKRVFEKGEPVDFTIDYDLGAVDHVDIKKATHKVINTVLTPVLDKDQKVTNVIVQAIDLSEIKKAEEEKIQAQQHAAEQEKQALVGNVAGKIAHDFNNILGVIMGNTELALIDCNDTNIKKTLELIFEQTLRGKNLTKNLVAFAKDHEPKQEFFKINEKIDLVLNLLTKDLVNIEVIKENRTNVPDLLADPGMIEHALVNFIQNSIHATSKVVHPRIIIRTYSLDENICFEIEDNGCGIPAEHLTSIYEPSFTLKGSRDISESYKSSIKGTGYGMANVKKYIELHKGNLSVESTVGSGTRFTVTLPVIKKELTKEEIIEIREKTVHFEKYILLIEDEMAISEVQYKVLTQDPCNHIVDIANNGQIAMDLFDRHQYDLISLDYMLPGEINGMEVYHHIRKKNKTVPILFISGNIEFLESIKALKQKDFHIDHLSKPCQNKDYINGINKLLEKVLIGK